MLKKISFALLALVLLSLLLVPIRKYLRPSIELTQDSVELAKQVEIIRDTWGVPHIFGKTNKATAFGLAYAHAEDDWPTIQGALAAAKGQLGLLVIGKISLINDYYTQMIGVEEIIKRDYKKLTPLSKSVLEGYAAGLNFYAYNHPEEVDSRLLPITPQDIAAGFVHKLPFMAGIPFVLAQLNEVKKEIGDPEYKRKVYSVLNSKKSALQESFHDSKFAYRFPGSNGHGLLASKSADNITRLNINSHQPWEGPVAWYEAHIVSDEGWNMTGGNFPGAPMIFHGHNKYLGWAHTMSFPDLIDVYLLKVREGKNSLEYKLDDQWLPLQQKDIYLTLDLGPFNLPIPQTVYGSKHGPVFKAHDHYYALRYASIDRSVFSIDQWLHMNMATNLEEFRAAFEFQGFPSFTTVYADRSNVFMLYSALLPKRGFANDNSKILPGDDSSLIWNSYVPVKKLPQSLNPPSGFVQNCNHSPFLATFGQGNMKRSAFSERHGIEKGHNNRSLRSERLMKSFMAKGKVSKQQFMEMKYDISYDNDAKIFSDVINPLLESYTPRNEDEKRAMDLLRSWDGSADVNSVGATIAIGTWMPLSQIVPDLKTMGFMSFEESFQFIVAHLKENYGTVEVQLGDVQKIRRGEIELSVAGGPDVLAAVISNWDNNKLIGFQGDSYILEVEFLEKGVRSYSRHQYGNSNRAGSDHYSDQIQGYANKSLKPTLRNKEELLKHMTERYIPGKE
jgi:acyl-homoserine-lactone acylase